MAAVRTLAFLFAWLLAAVAGNCAAEPFAVQVGDTRLGLDAPLGFSDTGFTGSPRLQELGESLTSPSNRILLFALTDGDLRRFSTGDTPEFKRHALIATPRTLERERLRPETFTLFVTESLRELGNLPAAGSDYRKLLDAQEGKVFLLAELRRDPEVVSVLQGARLPTPPVYGLDKILGKQKQAQYVLYTTTMLLVRGKALSLRLFAPFDSAADVDAIRAFTMRWVDELQRLNAR